MEDFHLSIHEHEGIRMSYVRKWVYKIHQGILYYRRLTHGRFEQDDLKQLKLNSTQLSYIQRLLSQEAFLHSKTFHCPAKEVGLQHRIILRLGQGERRIKQLFSGEEFELSEAQPQIEALWRRLHAWTSIQETAPTASPHLNPLSSLDIKWARGKTGSLNSQQFTFKDGYLSIQSDQGEKRVLKLHTDQRNQLLVCLEEYGDTLWKSKAASKRSRSFFDSYLIFELGLERKGQFHQARGEGFHFNLIEDLSFLQLELLIQLLNQLITGKSQVNQQISPQQAKKP